MGYKCPRSLFGLSVTVTGLFVLFSFTLQESLSDNNDSEFVHKDVDMVVRSIRTKYYDDYHDSHSSNKIIINHAENVTVQGEKSMVNRGESQNLKPHPIFPAKNSTQLKATLKEINNILQPIYKEITKKVTEFKGIRIREVKNLTTVQNVINGFEEHYFSKLEGDPQVHTIFIKENRSKVLEVLPSKLYDYSANTCEKSVLKDIPGDMINLYGAECRSLENASKPKNIPIKEYWNLELHSSVPIIDENDRVTLGFIHIVHNGMVGMDGDVYVGDKKIVPQRCHQNLTTAAPGGNAQELDEVFTIALDRGWTEYFHSTMEQLPRIAPYLQFLKKNSHIKIHMSVKRSYLVSMLGFLGIHENRTVAGTVRARIIYMLSGVPCMHPGFFNIQLLSMNFRSLVPDKPRNTVVVIKRSKRRWFNYHDDIIKMIQSEMKGSDAIRLSVFDDQKLPSLAETVSLFNQAFLVIGTHGAGLSNLLFSEPGTTVIEGTYFRQKYYHYRHLLLPLAHRSYSFYPKNIVDNCFNITGDDLKPAVHFYVKNLFFARQILKNQI